jgi:hypothetical protein
MVYSCESPIVSGDFMQKPVSNAYLYASLTESYIIIQTHHDFTNSKNLKKHIEKTSNTMGIHPISAPRSPLPGRIWPVPPEPWHRRAERLLPDPPDGATGDGDSHGFPVSKRAQFLGNADLQAEIQIFEKKNGKKWRIFAIQTGKSS